MLTPSFIGQAGKAWRSANVDLQREATLRAACQLAQHHPNLGELVQDLRQDSQGLAI
jgi:hypothetical protein